MTDCDYKERKALIEVWPDIHLILCLFHVFQSWKNKLKVVLGHHGGYKIVAFKKEIYQFLRNFTENLKNVNDSFYNIVLKIYLLIYRIKFKIIFQNLN
jgi:hypothetical protein